MKIKKNILNILLSFLLCSGIVVSTACHKKNPKPIGGDDDDPPVVVDTEYEEWLDTWSKEGHLYLHYNRGEEAPINDYEKYCLWIWPHKPNDLEGSLWAFSGNPKVSSTLSLKPMTTHWMYGKDVNKTGETTWKDDHGVIVDVDLYNTNLVGGKSGDKISFKDTTNVGFLIVRVDSMDGSSNWVSDGGKETYIKEFNTHFREDGSMHIFVNTGNLSNYTFESTTTKTPEINPTTKDETGKYKSETDVISDTYGLSTTSETFKELGVGYQIFVASFRDSDGDGLGDIRGIINSLDYLLDLGIEVLWLTPIQESDSYHGYDISDYYAVDSKFGSESDYRELIYKCHQLGIKIVMDLVLNHTSKNNVWFTNSQWARKGQEFGVDQNGNPINWRNVYHWKFENELIQKYNHQTSRYETITVKEDAESQNPSWYRDGESRYYYYGKFGSGMPEINYECQATRDLVKNMAKYWLSFGLDGFRLDAVKHIYMKDEVNDTGSDIIISDIGSKSSYDDEKGQYVEKSFDYSSDLTKNLAWWKEFSNDLKNIYPNCFLVGENFDGWGARIAPYYKALDSQFDFSNYYHICQFLYANVEGGPGGGASQYAYSQEDETFNAFSSNSDIALGDTGIKVPGGSRNDFINGSFTSNHDVPRAINQVNGTYKGPTETTALNKISGNAKEIGKAKIHAAVSLLSPGVSWIYYGDELGMSGNTDTHIQKYGNENSMDIWYRQPFIWKNNKDRANFSAGRYKFELDSHNVNLASAEEQQQDSNSMFNFYKSLVDIKNSYPKNAKCSFNPSSSVNVLIMDISGNNKSLRIFINTGVNSDPYSVGGMTSGYSFYKGLNGASANDISKPYSVLVYSK